MLMKKNYKTCSVKTETGTLEVNGIGQLIVINTGGSSASEGGMGSGSADDREKGDIKKPGEKSGNVTANEDDADTTFDPIKKNVKKHEKEQSTE